MVTYVSKTLNAWILFCKTWMATENYYYMLVFLQRFVQTREICTEHFKFSKVLSFLYPSWLLFVYLLELYISVLTTIIWISTCNIFFNNNILTQSIIFLPVFSSNYVLSRVWNIFPIQNKQAMIRIFA